MPLCPIPTYTSWQLACLAAIEPSGPPWEERIRSDAAIRAELQMRGKSTLEIEAMIAFAKQIGRQIAPIICMDIDDLELSIEIQLKDGIIGAAEVAKLRMFVEQHLDSPREAYTPTVTRHPRSVWSFVFPLGIIGMLLLAASGHGLLISILPMLAALGVAILWERFP